MNPFRTPARTLDRAARAALLALCLATAAWLAVSNV